MLYLPHAHTHTHRCECVCVYNLRFSLFSHSSFSSALKFKQSAINYTCWALSIILQSLSTLHFRRATQTFAYFGAPSSFNTFLAHYRSSIRFNVASLRQSVTPSVCQLVRHCASPALWQCVSRSEIRPQRSPFQGVAELGFANNFESNFHKLACHTLRALRYMRSSVLSSLSVSSSSSSNCQLLQL